MGHGRRTKSPSIKPLVSGEYNTGQVRDTVPADFVLLTFNPTSDLRSVSRPPLVIPSHRQGLALLWQDLWVIHPTSYRLRYKRWYPSSDERFIGR